MAAAGVIGFLGNHFGILHGLLLVLALVALAGIVSYAAREPQATRPVEQATIRLE